MESVLDVLRVAIRVVVRIRAPVQCRGDYVVASESIGMVVTSRFHDVNLAAGGPCSVGVFDGHHPDGGPQPITFRDLGLDFDTSVFDRCPELCVQPSRLYRRDD